MEFEWDPAKERINSVKHGINFTEAETVFGDPLDSPSPTRTIQKRSFDLLALVCRRLAGC
jgi:uncharacterized DUF497 family protein